MKLSTRMLVVVVLVVCATSLAQAWIAARRLEGIVVPNELASIRSHAAQLAAELNSSLVGITEDVAALRGSPTVRRFVEAASGAGAQTDLAALRSDVAELFSAQLEANPDYVQARIIAMADGGMERVRVDRTSAAGAVHVAPVSELQAKGGRDYVLRALNAPSGDVQLGRITLNREHGEIEVPHLPVVRACTPLHNAAGDLYGVLVINVDATAMLARMRSANSDDQRVFVVDSFGGYLAHPSPEFEFGADLETPHWLQDEFPELALALQTDAPHQPVDAWTDDSRGDRYYASIRKVGADDREPVFIVKTVSRDVLLEPAKAVRWVSLGVGVVVALLAALLAVAVMRGVTRDLEDMTAAVQGFSETGAIALPSNRRGEIGILADAFQTMAKQVAETTDSLQRQIVERRRAEADAQQLAAIVRSADDAIFSTTTGGVITSWNVGAERIFGFSEDEIVGQHMAMLVPAERRHELNELLAAIQRGDTVEHFESQRLCREGHLVDVSVSVSPINDATGRLTGVSHTSRDISRQKRAEQERDKYEERFRRTVEAAPTAIVMTDAQGVIVLVNAATELLFDYQRDELLGKSVEILVPDRFRHNHAALRKSYSADPVARQMGAGRDLFGLRKDRTEVPIEIGLSPVEMQDEVYVLSTIADISQRKAAEAELRSLNESLEQRVDDRTAELSDALVKLTDAKEDAECASHAKSAFLANMSHEIRTPMTTVTSAAELLLASDLDHKQREYTSIIRESCVSLLAVINDILDFSRIEAGQLALECIGFRHEEVISSAMKALGVRADAKGLELGFSIDPSAPDSLLGDPTRLRQALVNLVGNAVKFTATGHVWLDVGIDASEGDQLTFHYAVSDTGIGVPPEKHQSILEAFEQGDASSSRRFGGTGLGLSITSSLAAMMNGRLWFDSSEGFGSTFHFTARLTRQPEAGERDAERAPAYLQGKTALILERNTRTRRHLARALEFGGMSALEAADPDEAIRQAVAAAEDGIQVPLLIIDERSAGAELPGLMVDLDELCGGVQAPIIHLSSSEGLEKLSTLDSQRVAARLMKPVGQRELRRAAALALAAEHVPGDDAARPDDSAPGAGKAREPGTLRILLAEDNLANQSLIRDMLAGDRHHVQIARDGREAVQLWQSQRPDLVLMDLQMPVVDGLEATRAIRQLEENSDHHTPIIAITAHAMKGDADRCLAAGMDGYLPKPFGTQDLIETLAAAAQSFGLDARFDAAEAAAQRAPKSKPPGAVNWSVSLQSADGDPEVLRRLAEITIQETDDLLEQLRTAMDGAHADEMRICAANLRHHFKLFGAAVPEHVAFHIENTARDGSVDIAEAFENLCHENNRMQSDLVEFLEGRIDLS
ncbi:MAG: hypothetical protein CMJ58_04240 [Planctomycetaceae bacterium]|nr:hypothetical protein [Planctomycetaceae bacterium]